MTAIAERDPHEAAPGAAEHVLRAGPALSDADFERVRRQMLFDGCKWDPQVGDVAALAPFPLLIRARDWAGLRELAESLWAETWAAERALGRRPELHRLLAIPRRIRGALRSASRCGAQTEAARVARFDFHWTLDGWRVSEINSDVPGGFAEASLFPRLMASAGRGGASAGDPAGAWAGAMQALPGVASRRIALLAAPGYMEDFQVVSYLGTRLSERGLDWTIVRPEQIGWRDGRAFLGRRGRRDREEVGAVFRFYQAEWLAQLPARHWWGCFAAGSTPVVNAGSCILTESKRFPLAWDRLPIELPTWRALLPETRDPREVDWRQKDQWALKGAFCNTGDRVIAREWSTPADWRAARKDSRRRPGQWIAQRCFRATPMRTPAGLRYPCVGVYTIGGRAVGAYARLSVGPVVDFRAVDAALLVETQESGRLP